MLPALSWAVAHLVPAGPLRDGVLVTGLAPCEIASVATTALAGGEAAVAAGVLIGSTLATVLLAAPLLTLEAGHVSFSPGKRHRQPGRDRRPATGRGHRPAVPDPGHGQASGRRRRAAGRIDHRHRRGRGACRPRRRRGPAVRLVRCCRRRTRPVHRWLRRRRPPPRRAVLPAGRRGAAAHHLDARLRDRRRAGRRRVRAGGRRPLGLYGVAVLIWGTAAAGTLRASLTRAARGRAAGDG